MRSLWARFTSLEKGSSKVFSITRIKGDLPTDFREHEEDWYECCFP